jgi:AraC-like DNA-binding protein
MIEYLPRNVQHADLHVTQYGMEQCTPSHYHGPAVRDHYLIHYIQEGQGVFEVGGQTYVLGQGEGFLICPGIVTFYQADADHPWTYSWVGFNGLLAESMLKQAGMTAATPVLRYGKDDQLNRCLEAMIESREYRKGRDIRLTGLLYVLLSLLVEHSSYEAERPGNRVEAYTRQVVDFIEMNYAGKISISDIAEFIGLDRSYLSSLFKKRMNAGMQEYLIRYRMNKAVELMANAELSIGDIARSVGYEDPLLFSKIFKKLKGESPRQYRHMHVQVGQ